MATSKLSVKLFIDKKGRRVLFAEADKEFVDFLFTILTLPVGAVTRLLKEGGGMVGCLPSLHRSIENMSDTYIHPNKDKRFLLEPKVFMPGAKVPLLLPNVGSTFRQLYKCSSSNTTVRCLRDLTDGNNTDCLGCAQKKNTFATFTVTDPPPGAIETFSTSEEGYVVEKVTYMVMDDLDVKPMSTCTSIVTLLTQFNINDIRVIEEKVVELGMDEGVKLLQASLESKTVFTDIFLPPEIGKIEPEISEIDHSYLNTIKPSQLRALAILINPFEDSSFIHLPNMATSSTTKVSLKIFIDKKGRRVLYAEADKEFVDFLFGIFTLPVGVVFRLLKEESVSVGSLQSLYRSIENMSVTHIQPDTDKRFLLEPNVFMPGAKPTLLLPNVGSTFRQLYKCSSSNINSVCLTPVANNTNCSTCGHKKNVFAIKDPPSAIRAFSTSEEGYVRGTVTYMVTDDLEVKPLSTNSLVTLLSQFSLNDIRDLEEKVVDVGMDEGVKLLQASLQSKTILTDTFLPEKSLKSKNAGKGKCNAKEHIATAETSMELKITDMKSLEDYGM
ncbi:uncharacterized protein LOC132188077 [Corylus avellana]|uniref:uncharacterized protein LOC132188077 n=1 Tax=Corylus avellana TaxID=13451 RepID=UPI00286B33B6|nr:uncharacterized protein LOC132188077 [Corylus avellana]